MIDERVVVTRIRDLRDHPTRPDLQIAHVLNGQRRIVTGRHYREGQLGFFVPCGFVVPEPLLREMYLWDDQYNKGRLAGKKGMRVATKLMAGELSEGIFHGDEAPCWDPSWKEGDDLTDQLGILPPPS